MQALPRGHTSPDRDWMVVALAATPDQRWSVLLVKATGITAAGDYQYTGEKLPVSGAIIDVIDIINRSRTIRARVHHVDERHDLPIAAIEMFPD